MVSAQRRKQLSEARAARQPRIVHGRQPKVKRQKLAMTDESKEESSTTYSITYPAAPSVIQSTIRSSLDQSEEESDHGAWYWNSSSEDDSSDSEKGEGNQEHVIEPNNAVTHQALIMTQQDPAIPQTPLRLSACLVGRKMGINIFEEYGVLDRSQQRKGR